MPINTRSKNAKQTKTNEQCEVKSTMLSICNDTVHYGENKCTVLFYSASNTELQCILRQCEFCPNLLQYV